MIGNESPRDALQENSVTHLEKARDIAATNLLVLHRLI